MAVFADVGVTVLAVFNACAIRPAKLPSENRPNCQVKIGQIAKRGVFLFVKVIEN